jgi:hypothetical protein
MRVWQNKFFLSPQPINTITLSADREKIFALSAEHISCFARATGEALFHHPHKAKSAPYKLLSVKGLLALYLGDSAISLLSEEAKLIRQISLEKSNSPSLEAVSADGESIYLNSGYPNYSLRRINVTTSKEEWSFKGYSSNESFAKDMALFLNEEETEYLFFIKDKPAKAPIPKTAKHPVLSPDGSLLAYIGDYNIARIKDMKTQTELELQMYWGGIHTLLFSPDQSRLLCASHEGDFGCYDTKTGALLFRRQLRAHTRVPIIFMDDVLYLAISNRIERYDANTGAELDPPSLCAPSKQLIWANNSLYATSYRQEDRAVLQLSATGDAQERHNATHVAAAKDCALLVGKYARLVGDKTEVLLSDIGRRGVVFAAISPDAKHFVLRDDNAPSEIRAYSRSGRIQAVLEKDPYQKPCEGAFSADSSLFALIGKNPGILLFETKTWQQKDAITAGKTRFLRAIFHPNQNQLLVVAVTGELSLIGIQEEQTLWSVVPAKKKPKKENPPMLAFSPDGAQCFVAHESTLRAFSSKDGKPKGEHKLPAPISAMVAANNGALYLSLEDCSLVALDELFPPMLAEPKKSPGVFAEKLSTEEEIEAASWENFSIERDWEPLKKALLAIESTGGVTELHRRCTKKIQALGARLNHANIHIVGPTAYALSSNKKHLAVGSFVGDDYERGGHLSIWDVASGRCINSFHISGGGVGWPDYESCIQWSPDDSRLGLAWSTNAVGSLDPFSASSAWCGYSCATNGWSRPPAWCWSPDGKELFIACWGESMSTPGGIIPSEQGTISEQHVQWMKGPTWRNNKDEDEERLEPQKQVRWLPDGKIIGYNNHSTVYAIDRRTRELLWRRTYISPIALLPEGGFIHTLTALEICDTDGNKQNTLPKKGDISEIFVHGERIATTDAKGVTIYEKGRKLCQIKSDLKAKAFDFVDAFSWVWSPDGTHGAVLTDSHVIEVYEITKEAKKLNSFQASEYVSGLLWGDAGVIIAISPEVIQFWDALRGVLLADHPFTPEAEGEPLLTLKGKDLGARFTQNPNFSVKVDGRAEWAFALENGIVYAPSNAHSSLDTLLCFVLEKHSWPYRWSPIEPGDNASSQIGLPECTLSSEEKEELQKRLSKTAKKEVFPPKKKATLDDFIDAYLESVKSIGRGWHYHVSEQKRRLAIFFVNNGNLDRAKQMIKEIPEEYKHQALIASAVSALHLAKDKKNHPAAKEFLQLAEANKPRDKSWYQTWVNGSLGGAKFMLGDKKAAEEHFAEAEKGLSQESNQFQFCAFLAGIYLDIGETQRAIALMTAKTPWQGGLSHFFVRFFTKLLDGGFINEAEKLFEHIEKQSGLKDFQLLEVVVSALTKRGEHEKLLSWISRFQGLSTKELVAKTLLELAQQKKATALKHWTEKIEKDKQWPDEFAFWVELGMRLDSKSAEPYLDELYKNRKALSDKSHNKGEFASNLAKALLAKKKVKEATELKSLLTQDHERILFYTALGSHASAEAKKELKALFAGTKAVKENISELAKSAFEAGDMDEYKATIEKMLNLGTDWDRRWSSEAAIRLQISLGDWVGVYESIQKIPPSRRNSPLKDIIQGAVQAGKLAEALFFLQKLPTTDLNDRPNVTFRSFLQIAGLREEEV